MKITSSKIISRQELAEILKKIHGSGKISGFTSGAFDLLHAGHVDYLEKARSQCDILIVAVNSDESIRKYKSEKRPVIGQDYRARLVAGLASVDYVFIFDEINNNKNIEILQPKIYFKAADYSKEKLSSASIVESYGGKVVLIELTPGRSTTSIIDDILHRFPPVYAESKRVKAKSRAPAVFLDRDGTLNEHVDYLHEVSKFKLIEGTGKALKKLQDAGYHLIVVTNQPGIGMGYFTKEDLFQVNKQFLKEMNKAGVAIDKLYYCPHSIAEKCLCRKPSTGMIDRALSEMDIDISKSYVVGDTSMDIMLGKKAGCKTILVKTGLGGKDGVHEFKADYIAADIGEAAEIILKN
jgi:D-glycero-D-manno-heptose 1,7-bisphosphate phosphatase